MMWMESVILKYLTENSYGQPGETFLCANPCFLLHEFGQRTLLPPTLLSFDPRLQVCHYVVVSHPIRQLQYLETSIILN